MIVQVSFVTILLLYYYSFITTLQVSFITNIRRGEERDMIVQVSFITTKSGLLYFS